MALYRGPGGSVNSSIEGTFYATEAQRYANEAAASAADAATSATNLDTAVAAAQTSETNAKTSETNSKTSETNSKTSETNSASSAALAQQWATKTDAEVVLGQGFGAKKYSQDAASSAATAEAHKTAAEAAASSVMWQDVVFITSANSPYALDSTHKGKMIAVDASGGGVTINLPGVSTLDLTNSWSVGIKKSDSSANAITIVPNGTDVIDGSANKIIAVPAAGATLIPDVDPVPDHWVSAEFGAAAGNLTDEVFVAGTNFTAGTTTSLTLSKDYGSKGNITVHFDGVAQGSDQYSLSGATLTFTEAIPTGVSKVYVKGGTTLSVGTPADGTVSTVKMADAAVTTAKVADKAVTFDKLAADARHVPFKNVLINSNFDVWQRGTSQTTSGFGSDDRWTNGHNVSTKTHSQQAFAFGQAEVPHNPKFFSRTVVSSVADANAYVIKQQRIEGVRTLAGKTVTVSFYAKADAAKNIAIEFEQYFGSGGTPSATITAIGSQLIALTTAWKKHTVTVNIPSITGKTLGTDGNDLLSFNYWFDAGSNWNTRTASLGQQSGTFDIAQVQLEEGTEATPFEVLPYDVVLQRCQRYFYVMKHPPLRGVVSGTGSRVNRAAMLNPVPMRSSPSVTLSGVLHVYDGSATSTVNSIAVSWTTPYSIEMDASGATGLTDGRAGVYFNHGSNGSLSVSSEL